MIDSFPSTSESRFRAACDRCHELKNRCARRQGTDSRCERCERLELDCVYSTGARMGRPPGPQGKQQQQQAAHNSSAEARQAARPARGRGAAPYQGRRIHGSSASPAGAGKQSRAASPAPKRHRHHRRRAQSSVVAFGSYNSSSSEPVDLVTNGMTPLESASSSSGSGIQGSGILLSPLDSGAKSWLDAQDGVAVGISVDWGQEMASLAAEQAHVQCKSVKVEIRCTVRRLIVRQGPIRPRPNTIRCFPASLKVSTPSPVIKKTHHSCFKSRLTGT